MVLGQALDLEFGDKKKASVFLNRINTLKTALLFAASAKTGALSAGAAKKKATALEKFWAISRALVPAGRRLPGPGKCVPLRRDAPC